MVPPPAILGKACISFRILLGFVSKSMFRIMFMFLIWCDSRSNIPFHLVIDISETEENLKYTPRSDFHMRINDFPHLILKVNSKDNQSDKYHMLLQASSFCRIGNRLRVSTTQNPKPIIIMAIYIDNSFNAHQHLMYQPDGGSCKVVFNSFTGSPCLMRPFSRLNTSQTNLIWQLLEPRPSSNSSYTISSLQR